MLARSWRLTVLLAAALAAGSDMPNPSGSAQTYSVRGSIDTKNPFFQPLGTNGRACVTCHSPADGWSVTPPHLQARFTGSAGTDPIFRPVDGANCDDLDVSTAQARQAAYSLLLTRGLIRISLPLPAAAEFTVTGLRNSYGHCDGTKTLSVYRRPLPSANLRFVTSVMWDGRESAAAGAGTGERDLASRLAHQALDAVSEHEQGGTPLNRRQQREIVQFEMGLFVAQTISRAAGPLAGQTCDERPAAASAAPCGDRLPQTLAALPFSAGWNDPLGPSFTPVIFHQFDHWINLPGTEARASIARGQAIFNSKPIKIRRVGGLNDVLGQPLIHGTCGTCHNTPGVGTHSVPLVLNIGIADAANPLFVNYLPVYTLRNTATGATVETTDPGVALITGKWADVGKTKVPGLRGLAARAPYFHNGSAATLLDVVKFYESRFFIPFTVQERIDLANFLASL